MKREKLATVFIVLLISSILVIINGAWIASNGAPIIISSYPAKSLDDVWAPPNITKTSWSRIFLGVTGAVESGWAYFWLILAILLLPITVQIYRQPRSLKRLSPWIILLSLLSIPIGGGFYIGAIIGVIIGFYGMEFPKPFKDTFIGKIINGLRVNSKLFESITEDSRSLQTAVLTVIFVSILSGFGSSLYSFNVHQIYAKAPYDATAALNILIKGTLYTGSTVYTSSIAYISIGMVKWLLLSVIAYLLGVKLTEKNVNFSSLSSVLAYVYVPETILVFLPLIFSNEPNLSLSWQFFLIPVSLPLLFFYISRLWALIILVFALEKSLDTARGTALGIALLVATPYFLIHYLLLAPVLRVPGVRIEFTSESSMMILLFSSIALLIAALLGAFRKE